MFLSTTGANVSIPELGIDIVHPATDFDISAQFNSEEIKRAGSLTAAILAGTLIWKKTSGGAAELAASYDSDYLELAEELTGGQSSFGSYYQLAQSLGNTTNNSNSVYVTKVTLTTESLPLGNYRLYWKTKFWTSNANRVATIRTYDDVTVLSSDEPFEGSQNSRQIRHGFVDLVQISGVKTFTIQFKAGNAALTTATTVTLSESELSIWRIK